MSDLAIVGAGAWGCALAIQAARAGNRVTIWARTAPRRPLPDHITVTSDIRAVRGDLVLLAVPVQHMRDITPALPPAPIVACSKGVETGTLLLPLEILAELRPGVPLAVLTGPNFAHEIAGGQPAAALVASDDAALRQSACERLASSTFRLYGSADPIGAQIGGAAKNVIAIAAGVVIGAGLGENARAALVTRGLAEMGRLADALGGRSATTFGLSGLGDLLLTCTGPTSRNYSLGVRLGQGEALRDILHKRESVTEGVATAPALVARGAGIELPICEAVAALVQQKTTVRRAIAELLARPRKDE